MKEVILAKYGEIALKGLNRQNFEAKLIKNLRHSLTAKGLGEFIFTSAQSTLTIESVSDECDWDAVADVVAKAFGISAYSRAAACEKNLDTIKQTAVEYLADELRFSRTFKVAGRRADKKFPLTSPEIAAEVGGALLSAVPRLKVDIHNPETVVTVEIRDKYAFIHGNQLRGAGGMPTGTSGKAAVLISGGIDSPVAAWMMAKRGVTLTAVHFASPPFTSDRAFLKVTDLLEKVSEYSGVIKLYTVHFTELQERVRDMCPEDMFTIVMRQLMMIIAGSIAQSDGCEALITGESLAQVASQTIKAIACTDAASPLPVFRPCIGMDKQEIVEISRKIDCFDISIQPFEDCCTVFTPRHPKTKPTLQQAKEALDMMYSEELVEAAIKTANVSFIDC